MTGNNAWLPFTDENDNTSIEERRLFLEMSKDYVRHAKAASPKSYGAFSKAWDLEAGKRYLARLGGDENIIPIYCKTSEQLSTYFDKLEQENSASALATVDGMRRLHDLNRVLKSARAQIVTPQVAQVRPIAFPQAPPGGNRYTPMGNPVTMNMSAAFPQGLQANQGNTRNGAIPFAPPTSKKQVVPVLTKPCKTLFRKLCQKCGRMKKEHQSRMGCHFGISKCSYLHCGRCTLAQSYHVEGKMGVFCTVDTGAFPWIGAAALSAYDNRIAALKTTQP